MGIIVVAHLRGGALLLLLFQQRVLMERATATLQQRLNLKRAAGKIMCISFSLVVRESRDLLLSSCERVFVWHVFLACLSAKISYDEPTPCLAQYSPGASSLCPVLSSQREKCWLHQWVLSLKKRNCRSVEI